MVYYLKNGEIVARSYQTQNGFIFDTGTQFKKRNPFLMGDGFFVVRHSYCETPKDLKFNIKRLEKELHTELEKEEISEKDIKEYVERMGK